MGSLTPHRVRPAGYPFLAALLVVTMLGTSSLPPAARLLPKATAAYLGLMDHLGLLEPDQTSPVGVGPAIPEEMAEHGPFLPGIGPDGEPVGMLLGAGSFGEFEENEAPAALANPLSVSRVQSAYDCAGAVGNTLVITFTVRNNRPPAGLPDIPEGATLTETIETMEGVDIAADPNVIRNVLLSDELLPASATFLSAGPLPDRNGEALAWNLGDILPLDSVTATLRLQVPSGVGVFTELDIGATAWGTLQGRMVSSSTAPASLAPDGYGQWLIWTVDADYYDEYMVEKAAELGNDPQAMFEYVRGLGYESYKGSLRGTRGTLWSEAGNSLDQASLLIAMLRGSGVPARYRHGTLSTARAQELILSMFPEPQGVIGHIPSGTELADPANDAQLLEETTDHWWVEAYLPSAGDWVDLDPCFAGAAVGDWFYDSLAGDVTDQIAEVPDTVRHKVTVKVKIEQYYPLFTEASHLRQTYPLTHTFNTVELVGQPVTLYHLVDTTETPGLLFYMLYHTYIPHLLVGNRPEFITGEAFQDQYSNFPFGTILTTGEWLVLEIRDAEGQITTYEREIVDRLGFEFRQTGGAIDLGGEAGKEPLFSEFDLHTMLFAASQTPGQVVQDGAGRALAAVDELRDAAAIDWNSLDVDDTLQAKAFVGRYRADTHLAQHQALGAMGLSFYGQSDLYHEQLARMFMSRSYIAEPKVVLVSNQSTGEDTVEIGYDLLDVRERTLAYPSQSQAGPITMRMVAGWTDTALETSLLMRYMGPQGVVSSFSVLSAAADQGLPLEVLQLDTLDRLESLPLSPEAKARISEAVQLGKMVVVPSSMVTLNGESTVAWWEIDQDGYTVGVMENGWHTSMMEYAIRLWATILTSNGWSFVAGMVWGIITFLGTLFSLIHTLDFEKPGISEFAHLLGWNPTPLQWAWVAIVLTARAAPAAAAFGGPLFLVGVLTALSFITAVVFAESVPPPTRSSAPAGNAAYEEPDSLVLPPVDMGQSSPAPPVYMGKPSPAPPIPRATASYAAPATYTAGPLDAAMALPNLAISGTLAGGWQSPARLVSRFDQLTAAAGALRAQDGTLLGTGETVAYPAHSGSALAVGEGLAYAITPQGSLAGYAPALSGLGAASTWLTYSAELSATQPYTVALYDVEVTVDGADTYDGDFILVVTGTAQIEGSGHTAAPNFAGSASIEAAGVHLQLGPGTALAGSVPFSTTNGFGLANYSGPITITEHTGDLDRVELDGSFDQSLALTVDPASSAISPVSSTAFDAEVASNLADTYTLTVEGPPGWAVDVDSNGNGTATPPLGAEPGEYAILVTAQSHAHPTLFASAVHAVTTSSYQGMELEIRLDPLTTVPWGPAKPGALPGDVNSGRLQLTDAAFIATITNTSTTSHTFDLTVDDLPAGWLVLSGAEGLTETQITLPAGGAGNTGLYVSPTLTSLPPAETEYPFGVEATAAGNPSLTASEVATFTVPALAFNYLALDPSTLYAAANSTAAFEVELTNVGNTAGSFPLTVTLPVSTWTPISGPVTPVALAAGETDTQTVEFSIAGAAIDERHLIVVESPAPDTEYVQLASVEVQIVSARTLAIHQAAESLRSDCQIRADVTLPAAVSYLGTAINDLEGSCQSGTCALDLRDRIVSAARAVANHSAPLSPLITADAWFDQIADEMAGHTAAGDLSSDMNNLSTAVGLLESEACAVAAHDLAAAFAPPTIVALEGAPTDVDLLVENVGSLATTAVLTLTPPYGSSASWASDSVLLAPGEAVSVPTSITPTALGVFNLMADVVAAESAIVQHQAIASLAVVDALLRIEQVTASPAFVEHGAGTLATVYGDVVNVTNLPMTGNALLQAWAGDATEVYSHTTPVTLTSSLAAIRTNVGQIDTTSLATGTYTLTLQILDGEGTVIPKATGQGLLAVGQAVQAGSWVEPEVVAPGTVTVTTYITTALSQAVAEQWETGTGMFAAPPPEQGTIQIGPGVAKGAADAADAAAADQTVAEASRVTDGTVEQPMEEPDQDGSWPVTTTLEAYPTQIVADGTATATLTATVEGPGGGPVDDGVEVVFAANGGSLATTPVTETTVSGVATATLTSGTVARTTTVTATATAGITSTSDTTTVDFVAGPATTLTLSEVPTETVAGSTFGATVTAKDAQGNAATAYTGTVTFASSDPGATLPSSYAFTGGDSGVHAFSGLSLNTAGFQSLTVTDTVNGALTDSSSITVTAASADTGTSEFSATSPHQADGLEASTVAVTVTDAYSNPIAGAEVWIVASGTGNTLAQEHGTTSSDGVYTTTLTSIQPGVKVVRALVGDGQTMTWLPAVVLVEFTGSSLAGTVFDDPDQDDVLDSGETGLGGVQVRLVPEGESEALKTTVTASGGGYTFTGLLSGTYVLEQDQLDEFAFSGSGVLTVTVGEFATSTGHDFGNYAVAEAEGTVYYDGDQDGVYDPEEVPLADVTVNALDATSTLVDSTSTDGEGAYEFRLAAGLPAAPDNFVFNSGRLILQEPATAEIGNRDLSRGLEPLDPATYPSNYDFSLEALGDWTVSNGTYVNVVSNTYNYDGSHLLISRYGESGYSPAFTVPADAHSLRFRYFNWTTRNANENARVYVYALSGESFEISTQIGTVDGTFNQGWRWAALDLQAYQGQTIKLRFRTYWDSNRNDHSRIDDVSLNVEVPGWSVSDSRYVQVISDTYNLDGPYLRINHYGQSAYSAPFTVPEDAQSLRLDYSNWTARNATEQAQLYIYALSGESLEVSTEIGRLSGSFNQGWQTAALDLQNYRGQTIKLHFRTYWDLNRNDHSRIDNLGLYVETPSWMPSDARLVSIGIPALPSDPGVTAPENTDLSLGRTALATTTFPLNYDLSQSLEPLAPVTYPSNHDFALGTLGDWTVSNGTYVSVVSNTYNYDGYHLLISRYGESGYSPAFTVPADAHSLRFRYFNWTTRNANENARVYVYTLSGESFEISTQIGTVDGTFNQGWRWATLDLQAYQGQTIKLRFRTYWDINRNDHSRIDDVSLNVEVPGWSVSDSRYVQVVSDTYNLDGPYLRINHYGQSAYSAPFTVPEDAQSLRLDYANWTPRNAAEQAQLYIYALSGESLEVSTEIGRLSGSFNQGWQTAALDIQAYRGQTIKLRFRTYWDINRNDRARIDNLGFYVETPSWTPSDSNLTEIYSGSVPTEPGITAPLNADFSSGLTPLSASTFPGNHDLSLGRTPAPTSTYPSNYDFGLGALGDWTVSNGTNVSVVSDTYNIDGYHLRINRYGESGYTPAFTVPVDAQSLRFDYFNWTTRSTSENTQLIVSVRSGDNFEVSTEIGTVDGSHDLGWQTTVMDLQAFQGQTIKLRFRTYWNVARNDRARIDNISLHTEVPEWSVSDSRYVQVISDTYSTNGGYLRLNRYNQSAYTSLFTVPEDAQSLRFTYFNWTTRSTTEDTQLLVYALSGENLEVSTQLGSLLSSYNDGWQTAILDLQNYQGQAIKFRFRTYWDINRNDRARIDNLSLNIEVPDWSSSNTGYVRVGSTDPMTGTYLLLDQHDVSAYSAPFLVPTNTTSLQFDYKNWTDRNSSESVPLHVFVRHGEGYATYKEIGTPTGSDSDGWKQATLDLTPFRGRVVKLQFASDYDNNRNGKSRIDNLALLTAGGGAPAGDDANPGGTYLYLKQHNTSVTSSAFYVPSNTESVEFDYLVWTNRNSTESARLYVYALSGEGFGTATLIGNLLASASQGWLTASLSLAPLQGQVIKLRFTGDNDTNRNGKAKVDNITLISGASGGGGSYEDPNGEYLYLSRYEVSAYSAPFEVPTDTTTLRLDYANWSNRNGNENARLYIYALSGPDFGTSEQLAQLIACRNDGWQQTSLDLGSYENQTIKLRFRSDPDTGRNAKSKIDNVYLLPLSTTPYTITEINPVNYSSSTSDSVPIDAFGGGLFVVDFGDYAVDRYASTVEVTPTELVANGVSTATVTITLRDGDDDPMPGYEIEILAPGTEVTVTQPPGATDGDGVTTGTLRSTFAPQVVLVTARTISDNVTLAQSVPVTFTPGPPDAGRSSLVAVPAAVVANGVDSAQYTVTLRDQFDNLVPDRKVTVTVESTWPVTLSQPLSQTNALGQVTGTVRSQHDQLAVLSAYIVSDDITVTQTAEVLFSNVDPQHSSVEAAPHTLVADGLSTSTITVTLRDADDDPLAGKTVVLDVTGNGCALNGVPVSGPVDVGLTEAGGTVTATLVATETGFKTVSATGDGIPLDDTAQVTFTVGPVDVGASQLESDVTTVVADGVAHATLLATLYDSYSHPVPGKTVMIQSTGTSLVLDQAVTETNAQGQVQATLGSTDVQTVTVSAYDQSDDITVTQTVELSFVAGPADATQSTLSVSPTTVLADGVQTTTITATLRDSLGHPTAGRAVQLEVSGQHNTITPSTQGSTDVSGTILFALASTDVETKTVAVRDIPNDVSLPAVEVAFVAGEVDAGASQLASDKTTVLIVEDEATVTATLYDAFSHRMPGRTVLIQTTGIAVTVTQPITVTNSLGQVQATISSSNVQTCTVSAYDQTDNLTVTQEVELSFVAGPADPAQSTIEVSPTVAVANNADTATITATLRDEGDNPLSVRSVQLIVSGSDNTITPAVQQDTDASGIAVWNLASFHAETKNISVLDVLGDATLPADAVTFLAGPLSTSHSTLTSDTSRGPADGVTPITVTVRTLDSVGNPIAGLPVTLSASIPGVTITQPAAPSDAGGYAYAAVVGTVHDSATIRAYVSGVRLDASLVLTFDPVHAYTIGLDPAAGTTAVGGIATFDVEVHNQGYRPDDYEVALEGLDTISTTLAPVDLSLAAGQIGHATLVAWTDVCAKAGSYEFFVKVSSEGVGNTTTVDGDLSITSQPVLHELSPADGTSIGATSALFSWQTAVSSTTSLFLKPITATAYTEYTGTGGTMHGVSVSGLSRNAEFEWYARSESICGASESPTRTLYTLNGVEFTERSYTFTIDRDYDQRLTIGVHNQDIVSHTVVVSLENPYEDLIVAFVDEGSVDDPIVLQPGQTRNIKLVAHTQDATQSGFDLVARLTADDGTATPIEDAVPVGINVTIPNFNFAVEQTGVNTQTLVTYYRVTNYGDPLTDLALTAEVSGTGTVYLLPAMSHGYLGTGQSFEFEAIPAIDTSFQSISGTINAVAGGMVTSTAISLSLPLGSSIFLGEATDVSMETITADWYCTNRPVIRNTLVLPPGFRRADVAKATFLFKVDSARTWSGLRPHDVHIILNDHEIGAMLDMIPHGMYTFPVDPDHLNESQLGPSINNLRLETLHLNGGHYVVASDMMLFLCLEQYREWVAATTQEEANQIVSSRSFLTPAPAALSVEILQPLAGETVNAGMPTPVKVQVTSDLTETVFFEVTAQAGASELVLLDDGVHDDGDYRDGVYANDWIPLDEGQVTLSVHAGSCTVAGDAQITVTVDVVNYDVEVLLGLPATGTEVLSNTVTPNPRYVISSSDEVRIDWNHELTQAHTSHQNSVDVVLPDLHAGEVRQVTNGMVISYTGPGGTGLLQLPPLTVVAQHIVAIAPSSQAANLGGQAVYAVELANPGITGSTYSLSVAGLPAGWADLAESIWMAPGTETNLPLTITVPSGAELGERAFSVAVETGAGGSDQAGALLEVLDLIELEADPQSAIIDSGETLTYTIVLTNLETIARTYDLSLEGLEGNVVVLQEDVTVEAGDTVSVPLQVTAYAAHGAHPFTIMTVAQEGRANRQIGAVLEIVGHRRVVVELEPTSAVSGPGASTFYTVAVTNAGQIADIYDLSVSVPSGWSYQLEANSSPVSSLALSPYLFDTADLLLWVTPAIDAAPGFYAVGVGAQSQANPFVSDSTTAELQVTEYGVQVDIEPDSQSMAADGAGVWNVTIHNHGSHADTYDLAAGGIVAASGEFSQESISVAAGEQETVQLTADELSFALPTSYPFAVTARSQYDPNVYDYDLAQVTFLGYEDVTTELTPTLVTLTDTDTAQYMLLITNTGNVSTIYTLTTTSDPGSLDLSLAVDELYIPPHMVAGVLVTARPAADGVYTLTASAASTGGPAAGESEATLVVEGISAPSLHLAKKVEGSQWYPGELVTYTLIISNDGDAEARNVVVSDALPLDVEYAWDDQAGTYDPTDHDWSWGPLTVSVGSKVTATLLVTVSAEVTPGIWITNTAYLFYEDADPLETKASHYVQPSPPALFITKKAEPEAQLPGQLVTYTLVFGNQGGEATGVIISDVLPAEVDYAWSDDDSRYDPAEHELVWGPLTLTTGSRITSTVVVTASKEITFGTRLTNTAFLLYDGAEPLETEALHQIQPISPTLFITKTAEPEAQLPGQLVTYTLVFGNQGGEATGVIISDVLPAEVDYAWSDNDGSYDAVEHELIWEPLTLTTGSRVTATVVVTVGQEVTPGTRMTNTAFLFYEGTEPLETEAPHQVQPPCLELTATTISGEIGGQPGTYTFTTSYEPAEAAPPITYAWDSGDNTDTSIRSLTMGTHTLAVTATNCTSALVTASHTIVITALEVCTDVTGVNLMLVTTGTVSPETTVTFHADMTPDDANKPYSYVLSVDGVAGNEQATGDDPLVFTRTFATAETHAIQIAVWNCAMQAAEAATSTVSVPIRKVTHDVYLPTILKTR